MQTDSHSEEGHRDAPVGTVELPRSLLDRVEARVDRTEFEDADAYVALVLEEVLSHVERDTGEQSHERVSEREVEDRLRSLGYLDT